MKPRTAPCAATWLLERIGGRSRCDPLIGDLLERFEQGHSRVWYWRQAIGALAIDVAQTLRVEALSFAAAVVAGCALIRLCHAGYSYALRPLRENLSAVSGHPWTAQAVLRAVGLATSGLLSGALIVVTAWAVTRIHRSHPRAVLSVFAAAVTVQYLPGVARLVIHAATDPRFTAPLVSRHLHFMMPVAWQALCILAAGLWMVRRPRFTARFTRFVAVFAVSLCVLAVVARAAALVGELSYTLQEQYLFDLLNVGSVAYLVFLLWRPNAASGIAGQPPTHAGSGL